MDLTGKILIVDDNTEKLKAISKLLSSAGCNTLEASTGKEALRLAKEEDPDLILLDVKLADMDGFEVCRQIKADPILSHIIVVHFSATLTSSENSIHGLETGADGYIVLPISNEELLARLKAFIRLKKTENTLRANEVVLKEKNQELKSINEAVVGRELKMIEMEKEINSLLIELGRKPKYK